MCLIQSYAIVILDIIIINSTPVVDFRYNFTLILPKNLLSLFYLSSLSPYFFYKEMLPKRQKTATISGTVWRWLIRYGRPFSFVFDFIFCYFVFSIFSGAIHLALVTIFLLLYPVVCAHLLIFFSLSLSLSLSLTYFLSLSLFTFSFIIFFLFHFLDAAPFEWLFLKLSLCFFPGNVQTP